MFLRGIHTISGVIPFIGGSSTNLMQDFLCILRTIPIKLTCVFVRNEVLRNFRDKKIAETNFRYFIKTFSYYFFAFFFKSYCCQVTKSGLARKMEE